jgi:hypothetical protein
MLATIAALAIQAVHTVTPPPSPTADANADARCMIMFTYLGGHGDPLTAEHHKRLVLYFTGKLKGRDPAVDIGKTVVAASKAAQAARPPLNNRAELARCSADVEAASAGLRSIRDAAAANP